MKNNEIKSLRLALMLNQGELAKELHVSRFTISFWENGKRSPTLFHLRKLNSIAIANGIKFNFNSILKSKG